MTTSLFTTSNADFDNCFEQGAGNQLLYIYAQDGQDIGQRYYNVSEGSAYGATGMLASSGTDVGQLLCKAGARDDGSVVVTAGSNKSSYGWKSTSTAIGSISRTPYWINGSTRCLLTKCIYQWKVSNFTIIDFSETPPFSGITVNGVAFTYNRSDGWHVKGNPLSISKGATTTLVFSPRPDGFV